MYEMKFRNSQRRCESLFLTRIDVKYFRIKLPILEKTEWGEHIMMMNFHSKIFAKFYDSFISSSSLRKFLVHYLCLPCTTDFLEYFRKFWNRKYMYNWMNKWILLNLKGVNLSFEIYSILLGSLSEFHPWLGARVHLLSNIFEFCFNAEWLRAIRVTFLNFLEIYRVSKKVVQNTYVSPYGTSYIWPQIYKS